MKVSPQKLHLKQNFETWEAQPSNRGSACKPALGEHGAQTTAVQQQRQQRNAAAHGKMGASTTEILCLRTLFDEAGLP